MADRTLPHNLEAERSVLGAILVHNDAFNLATEVIDARDFYRDAHVRIFRSMAVLNNRRQAIDFVTLKEELSRVGDLDEVGGPAYVASLADGVPRATNVEYYAGIIKEKAQRRRIIFACNKALTGAYEGDLSIEELIEATEADVLSVSQEAAGADFVTADTWVNETFEHLQRVAADPRHVTGVPTGFAGLDRITRGFQPGDLIIVGSRPSMGKTSLALQCALEAANHAMAGLFSVEMSRQALGIRAFSLVGRINGMRLMTGRLRGDEYERIAAATNTLSDLKIAIDDSPILTPMQLRMKARRLKARHGLGSLFVDYLQILEPATIGKKHAENRNLELAQMTRGLKQLAKELQVPVVVLSQLSRDLERREDKRPRLSDLRDSGAVEQDSDVVLLLYRPEVYQGDTPRPEDVDRAELIVAKQRNGPTGIVELRWIKEHTRFEDWTAAA